jgi:hypothetical protein
MPSGEKTFANSHREYGLLREFVQDERLVVSQEDRDSITCRLPGLLEQLARREVAEMALEEHDQVVSGNGKP